MSYGSTSPKTAYGDELLDDGWTGTGQATGGPSTVAGYPQQSNPYQKMNPMPNNFSQPPLNQPQGMPVNQDAIESPQDLMNVSMSPEDLKFMHQVREDLFLTRVAPFSTIAFAAQYIYNQQKQLPHQVARFVALGFGSLLLSLTTYKSRFKQKITETPLVTPYIETVRKNLGLPLKSEQFAVSSGFNQRSEFGSSDGGFVTEPNFGGPPTTLDQQRFGNQSFDSGFEKGDSAKPVLSYEELRAKNRGYTRITQLESSTKTLIDCLK